MVDMSAVYALPGLEIYLIVIGILLYTALMIMKTPKQDRNKPTVILILLSGMMGASGIVAILYGLMQLIGSKSFAEHLGRDTSPYQLQLAMAEIGAGIVGSTTLLKPDFMVPAMITKISLSVGLAYSISTDFVKDRTTPNNEMVLQLWWSLLFPIIILILFAFIKILKVKRKVTAIKDKVSVGQCKLQMMDDIILQSQPQETKERVMSISNEQDIAMGSQGYQSQQNNSKKVALQ